MKIEHEYDPELDTLVETDESYDRRMSEKYKANPKKPWRISWGFGCFSDHATKEIAQRAYKRIPKHLSPQEPFRTGGLR